MATTSESEHFEISHPAESTLEQSILNRHSVRKFLPTPVPRPLLDNALTLAQHAPSNSNIQPWNIVIVSGAARDRLASVLLAAASEGEPHIKPLPDSFRHFRSELGLKVYGEGMGIPREDKEGRAAAVRRNFEFFGAPTVGIVCMDRELGSADALSVGMYVQTLLLALTEKGLASCVEVSVAGYADELRRELEIDEKLEIICAVAIGYADEEFRGNSVRIGRIAVEESVRFVG